MFRSRFGLQRGSLDQILYTAILENKVDFVRLLLENPAVHLREFTTVERILHLYNDIPKESILFKLLDGYRAKATVGYTDIWITSINCNRVKATQYSRLACFIGRYINRLVGRPVVSTCYLWLGVFFGCFPTTAPAQ